jgi:hypothetical protein
MTQPTDDLAALAGKMVREIFRETHLSIRFADTHRSTLEAIARRYMEKAVATVSADAFHDGYHAGKIDAARHPEKGSTDDK